MIAFVIKAPLFPFHGWLPDAYREAPPEVAAAALGRHLEGRPLRAAVHRDPALPDARPTTGGTSSSRSAAISLVYGSLLAFRAPDVRGVVAYSSLAQAGLITLGLFANNSLGFDGAVLQIVNHGLFSAALFLLAGMVERRTSTGELARLGGMARGRPALATLLMTVGVISLAVPLSTSFAGEFLILAGVFQQGWGWAVVGAVAIVLAAMYMLRVISGVLHQDVGPAVSDSALDLRLGELAVVVPLVLCLIGLSAWPNLISSRAAGNPGGLAAVRPERERQVIQHPHVDWFALSPSLALIGAVGPAADGRRLRPAQRAQGRRGGDGLPRRSSAPARSPACSRRRARTRRRSSHDAMWRDRWGVDRAGADRRLGRDRRAHLLRRALARGAHRRVLRAAHRRGRRDDVLRPGGEPDDAVPRARVVLGRALRADRDRHRPDRIARGGPQVPRDRRRRLGDAALRLGARLRRDRAAVVRRGSPRRATSTT